MNLFSLVLSSAGPGCLFSVGLVIPLSLLISSWILLVIFCLKSLSWIFLGSRVGICRRLLGLEKSTAGGLDGSARNEIKPDNHFLGYLVWLSCLSWLKLMVFGLKVCWMPVLIGSCHVALVPTCQGFVIWGGSMLPWSYLKTTGILSWGSGLSKRVSSGASGWIFEAPVLYHGFYQSISPWVLPRLGEGIGKRRAVTSGNPLDCRSNFGKRVGSTRKTRPVASSGIILDPGHPTPRRGKDCAPLPPEWGARWASLAFFFLALGLAVVCTGDAWNLLSEGTGVVFFPAGQSSRRDQCIGTGPFN